jgi:hypothetical protein
LEDQRVIFDLLVAMGTPRGSLEIAQLCTASIAPAPTGAHSLFGGTQEQQKADWEEHGIAALMGGVAPYALTTSPGFVVKELPAGANVFDRMLAEEPHPTVIVPEIDRPPSLADLQERDAALTEPKDAGPRWLAWSRKPYDERLRFLMPHANSADQPPQPKPMTLSELVEGQDKTSALGGGSGNSRTESGGAGPGPQLAGAGNAGQESAGARSGDRTRVHRKTKCWRRRWASPRPNTARNKPT